MKKQKRFCYRCGRDESFEIVEKGEEHVAWESSHVVAWESSHVVARESSHVVARGSSHVVAWGSSHVVASKFNSVTIHGKKVKASGGVQIQIPEIMTAKEWCDYYGVEIKKGVAVLYKATDKNFHTRKGVHYTPGTTPEALDWDGGKLECGGGLHFSPHPQMAIEFRRDAEKFVACPVKVSDIVVHKDATYPQQIKAPKCCAPVWECDRNGNKIDTAPEIERATGIK